MLVPGDDSTRFSSAKAATLTGYVVDVRLGGLTSANCHSEDPENRDIHIELALEPNGSSNRAKHVMAIITPRIRDQLGLEGHDLAGVSRELQSHRVTLTGWLYFDLAQAGRSANTANQGTGPQVWRATAWELRPVTAIVEVK